ncbi:MAG: sulfite dehydrogenase, partial [Pseudomonadota bacterium]
MTADPKGTSSLARRGFLQSAGMIAGTAAATAAGAKSTLAASAPDPDSAITELKDWNQYLGYGVDAQG